MFKKQKYSQIYLQIGESFHEKKNCIEETLIKSQINLTHE